VEQAGIAEWGVLRNWIRFVEACFALTQQDEEIGTCAVAMQEDACLR
jgi:hypothetical protein